MPLYLLNAAIEATRLPAVEGITWEELSLTSTFDQTEQPIVVGVPSSYEPGNPTPLLVALHTWSYGYRQPPREYGPEAARRGWLLVVPHFRGPNLSTNPRATDAGGSLAAQHDIIDAVEYMKATYAVEAERVYLSGASGGGHMALLMAGKCPDVWGAVCAWCPITDLREWHAEGNPYAQHVEAVCGGVPGASPEVDFEYLRRSPRSFITNAGHTPILLGHGDRDPTIPTEQSWRTFLRLRDVPQHLAVFRSWSAGHVGLLREGLDWAEGQRRPVDPPTQLDLVTDEAKWYHWLFLEPAGPLRLGRAVATLGETTLAIEVQDLVGLRVSFRALHRQLPTSVRCDGQELAGVQRDEAAGEVRVTLGDTLAHVLDFEWAP